FRNPVNTVVGEGEILEARASALGRISDFAQRLRRRRVGAGLWICRPAVITRRHIPPLGGGYLTNVLTPWIARLESRAWSGGSVPKAGRVGKVSISTLTCGDLPFDAEPCWQLRRIQRLTPADICSRAACAARAIRPAGAQSARAGLRAGAGLGCARRPGPHEALRTRRMDGLRTRPSRGVSKRGHGASSRVRLPEMPA